MSRNELLSEVRQGIKLKKTVTQDKSKPYLKSSSCDSTDSSDSGNVSMDGPLITTTTTTTTKRWTADPNHASPQSSLGSVSLNVDDDSSNPPSSELNSPNQPISGAHVPKPSPRKSKAAMNAWPVSEPAEETETTRYSWRQNPRGRSAYKTFNERIASPEKPAYRTTTTTEETKTFGPPIVYSKSATAVTTNGTNGFHHHEPLSLRLRNMQHINNSNITDRTTINGDKYANMRSVSRGRSNASSKSSSRHSSPNRTDTNAIPGGYSSDIHSSTRYEPLSLVPTTNVYRTRVIETSTPTPRRFSSSYDETVSAYSSAPTSKDVKLTGVKVAVPIGPSGETVIGTYVPKPSFHDIHPHVTGHRTPAASNQPTEQPDKIGSSRPSTRSPFHLQKSRSESAVLGGKPSFASSEPPENDLPESGLVQRLKAAYYQKLKSNPSSDDVREHSRKSSVGIVPEEEFSYVNDMNSQPVQKLKQKYEVELSKENSRSGSRNPSIARSDSRQSLLSRSRSRDTINGWINSDAVVNRPYYTEPIPRFEGIVRDRAKSFSEKHQKTKPPSRPINLYETNDNNTPPRRESRSPSPVSQRFQRSDFSRRSYNPVADRTEHRDTEVSSPSRHKDAAGMLKRDLSYERNTESPRQLYTSRLSSYAPANREAGLRGTSRVAMPDDSEDMRKWKSVIELRMGRKLLNHVANDIRHLSPNASKTLA